MRNARTMALLVVVAMIQLLGEPKLRVRAESADPAAVLVQMTGAVQVQHSGKARGGERAANADSKHGFAVRVVEEPLNDCDVELARPLNRCRQGREFARKWLSHIAINEVCDWNPEQTGP